MFHLCILLLCLGAVSSAPRSQKFKFLEFNKKLQVLTVRLGLSVNIDCETTDASAVVTLWKTKGVKEVEIKPSLNVIQSGQIFTMHNIAFENAGNYKCKAEDSMHTIITKDVVVHINTFRPSLNLRPSNPQIALTGSTVSFTCEAVVGTILWRHVPSRMQINPKPSKYTVKNIVNATISYSILTLPNAQVSNSGIYECWLYHYDTTLFRNVDLQVRDSQAPVIINSQAETKTVKPGHSKKLNCEANGFPKPVISWEKNGRPLTLCYKMFLNHCSGSHYLTQPRGAGMKIKSARFPQDNATYTCVARNSAGVTRKNFHVIVEVAPVLDKSVGLLIRSSKVTCHAIQGNPPPKFIWTIQLYWYLLTKTPNGKNWKPISQYKHKPATVSSDGMTSTINVPSVITRAFYRCVVVNNAGSDSHTIKIMKMY